MGPADIIFLVIGFFAEVVGTMAGFGSSTIYLPLASYFVDLKTALVLIAIILASLKFIVDGIVEFQS